MAVATAVAAPSCSLWGSARAEVGPNHAALGCRGGQGPARARPRPWLWTGGAGWHRLPFPPVGQPTRPATARNVDPTDSGRMGGV